MSSKLAEVRHYIRQSQKISECKKVLEGICGIKLNHQKIITYMNNILSKRIKTQLKLKSKIYFQNESLKNANIK